jgi:hypothetical protein
MGQLRWFAVFDTKGLVRHENSQDPYSLPDFYSGESPYAQFMGLQVNSAGAAGRDPWGKIDPSSFGLRVGLYRTATSAQLAFQDIWANDLTNFIKTAQLVYDSVAVTAALAAEANDVAVTMEWEVTPTTGGAFKIQARARLKPGLITPASATVPAGEVAATQGWTRQICVPRDGTDPNNPCDGFYIKTRPSGFQRFVYWDDTGTQQSAG